MKVLLISCILVLFTVFFVFLIINDGKKEELKESERYNEIEYVVPEGFEGENHFYSHYGDDSCYFDLYASYNKYEDDFENWFKSSILVSMNDEVGELKEITVNGKKAYSIDIVTDNDLHRKYGFNATNYYYMIDYTVRNYNHGDIDENSFCMKAIDDLISSVKTK